MEVEAVVTGRTLQLYGLSLSSLLFRDVRHGVSIPYHAFIVMLALGCSCILSLFSIHIDASHLRRIL